MNKHSFFALTALILLAAVLLLGLPYMTDQIIAGRMTEISTATSSPLLREIQ